ncbi:MAG: hypothetical protein ACM3QW_03145, partial [Ignavibacteriales bacterium]
MKKKTVQTSLLFFAKNTEGSQAFIIKPVETKFEATQLSQVACEPCGSQKRLLLRGEFRTLLLGRTRKPELIKSEDLSRLLASKYIMDSRQYS